MMKNGTKVKDSRKAGVYIYLSLFLTSISLFVYEVLLTRLFSAILSFSMVFLVASLAILGSGIGGMLAYQRSKNKKGLTSRDLILRIFPWLPLSIAGTIAVIYYLPYISAYLLYALIGAIPFIIGGIIVSSMFKDSVEGSSKLYFMDLVGSSLGSILVLHLMNKYGFMLSVIMVCILSSIAAIAAGCYYMDNKRTTALGIFAVIFMGLFIQGSWVKALEKSFNSYYTNPNKLIYDINNSTQKAPGIPFTKWDSLARTDVIETTDQKEKIVVTDGGGAAPIVKFDGNLNTVDYLKNDVKYIPFTFGTNNNTLIIGSGGGKDVLFALLGGSKRVDAVEINPSTIEAVNNYKGFSGDIYNRPGVKVYIQDGRSFVENSKDKYDDIYLSMVMTNSVENNMYSLSENYIYTTEAFKEYLSHLSANGKLSFMAHGTIDTLKITNTGIKVLLDKGVKPEDVTNYFIIVNGADAEQASTHDGGVAMPVIMFKNVPFTEEEINSIKNMADMRKMKMLHYPGKETGIYKLLKSREMTFDEILNKYPVNIKPINDNSPFFYNYTKFVPIQLIYILLAVSLIFVFIRIKYLRKPEQRKASVYFTGLGAAFMLVEVSIIQKMVLYFGSPSLAFSVVLFSLLVSCGIGSFISGLDKVKKIMLNSPVYLLTAASGIIIVELSIGNIISLTNDFVMPLKYIIAFSVMLPMGLLMGIPFPTGMNRLKDIKNGEDIIPLMWGVNGLFSVVGSVLAVMVSMTLGFTVAVYSGALIYMLLYLLNPLKLKGAAAKAVL